MADEAETLAGDRPDKALLLAGVADGLANRVDVTGDRRFRHDSAAPYCLQQVVLANDAVAVPDEMQQQVEDLRPDRHDSRAMCELPAFRVQHVAAKRELHVGTPWPSASVPLPGNWRMLPSMDSTATRD